MSESNAIQVYKSVLSCFEEESYLLRVYKKDSIQGMSDEMKDTCFQRRACLLAQVKNVSDLKWFEVV